jgi:hypothetical protein
MVKLQTLDEPPQWRENSLTTPQQGLLCNPLRTGTQMAVDTRSAAVGVAAVIGWEGKRS